MSSLPSEAPQPEGQLQKTPNPKRVAHAGSGNKCPQEVKDAVLERITNGMGVGESMRLSGYHKSELYDWIREDDDYARRFKMAKEALAHHYAEESVTLLDDGSADTPLDPKRASAHVNLLGQRSKARQWLASKWNSKDYGEKIEHSGTVTNAVVLLPPLEPLPAIQATARVLPTQSATLGLASGADEAEVVPD